MIWRKEKDSVRGGANPEPFSPRDNRVEKEALFLALYDGGIPSPCGDRRLARTLSLP